MQALFYIGLFGAFFTVMSSITVGVSMSTMQRMVDQRANVKEMFKDVDFAINRIILRESPSLEAYLQGDGTHSFGPDDIEYTAENISWSPQQLQTDPWGSDVEVVHISEPQPLGADVVADVDYFILASPGLDREMETQLSESTNLSDISTFSDWRKLRSAGAAGDDIIHTFSTKDALNNTWNASYEVERKIIDKAQRVYNTTVEQFNSNNNNQLNKLTTCARFGVTDNQGLDTVECAPYSPELITKCNQVYEGASTALFTPSQSTPDGGDEVGSAPGTSNDAEVDLADVALDDCWRYDPILREKSDFPAMAGNMGLYKVPDTPKVVATLGVKDHIENDPFFTSRSSVGSIVFEDRADHPHQLLLQRASNDSIPGWDFSGRETLIEPK